MAGINRFSGEPLVDGWEHTKQSIGVILTTPKVSRVMRRFLGADLPRLVDSPISPVTVIDFFAACAQSMEYEPRFKVSRMKVDDATSNGTLALVMEGVYYPRGHLGDFTVSQPQTIAVPL